MPTRPLTILDNRTMPNPGEQLSDAGIAVDYRALAQFRFELRKFLAFSEAQAEAAGILPQQYQAMVAIKGFSLDETLTIGDLAERLCIRPHSCVELVDRMSALDLVERFQDIQDRRRVRIKLTTRGEAELASLAVVHVHSLRRIGPTLIKNLRNLETHAGGLRRSRHRRQSIADKA